MKILSGNHNESRASSLLKKAIVAIFTLGHATASCARGLPNMGFCESHVWAKHHVSHAASFFNGLLGAGNMASKVSGSAPNNWFYLAAGSAPSCQTSSLLRVCGFGKPSVSEKPRFAESRASRSDQRGDRLYRSLRIWAESDARSGICCSFQSSTRFCSASMWCWGELK